MLNTQSDRKLLQKWIVANTASLTIGCTFFIFLNKYYINYAKPNFVYKPEQIYFWFASLAIPATMTGIFQWLVIKTKIPRISIWWTLTNIPGLYAGLIIAAFTFSLALVIDKMPIVTNFYGTAEKLLSYDVYEFLFNATTASILGLFGGVAGGLITGITQILLLVKQIDSPSWKKKWIKATTLSWAISWSFIWAIFLILSSFTRKNLGFYCVFSTEFLWTGLGMLCGFLNGAISGRVLVWLLRQSRQSQSEN